MNPVESDEVTGWDDERIVDLSEDRHADDSDDRWDDRRRDDDRLLDERPPHWD